MAGLLLFLAHPDDEFFCAGALAAMAAKKVPVHVVYWTAGEGGRKSEPWWSWRGWSNPRRREAKRALRGFGLGTPKFLNYVDPDPRDGLQAPRYDPAILSQELDALVERWQPEIVLTHGSAGDYGHPAHQVLHRIVSAVLMEKGAPAPFFLSFNAWHPEIEPVRFLNRGDGADLILDSAPYAVLKQTVLEAHRSQYRVLAKLTGPESSGLDSVMERSRYEGYHCWDEEPKRKEGLLRFQTWTGAVDKGIF
jgi:LmbE family N-acetylglucosaminyl deacetylase